MFNPFKKKPVAKKDEKSVDEKLAAMPGAPKLEDMKWHERFAMKRFMKMSPEEQKKMVAKAMTPKNIAKHKDEIAASLDAMMKAGQMSPDQYRLAKRKFGLK
jgi:hypothetical protein